MKKSILILVIFLVSLTVMAFAAGNAQVTTTSNYIGATVDTDPGATGYGTIAIRPLEKNPRGLIGFAITGGTATVDLQFRVAEGDWETEGQYTAGDCKNINDPFVQKEWRGWVLDDNQGTGTTAFGFVWGSNPRY